MHVQHALRDKQTFYILSNNNIQMKRLYIILLMAFAFSLTSHAVLKEKDLESTLAILRSELTKQYLEQQKQAKFGKRIKEQVRDRMFDIMKHSKQNSLMLYSQKSGYVFDLTYACHEATEMYRNFQHQIMPFRTIVDKIDIETARYDSLVVSLSEMPVVILSEKGKTDRNVCLTLAVHIKRTMEEMRTQLNDYIGYYEHTEKELKMLNDYAQKRYSEIQSNIFINGGDSYFKILSRLQTNVSQTTETISDKYQSSNKTRSDWDSRVIIGLFVIIVIYGIIAALLNLLVLRVLLPKRFRSEGFIAKRTCITMTTTVITFALILGIVRLTWQQNFIIMASNLLVEYAWLLGVILISLLLRVNGEQIKSTFRIYSPLIVIGFIVISFRIILIPNDLVNLVFPPILLVCTLWQWSVIRRHNDNIPRSDVFYTYISLAVFVASLICSWSGYTLLSVQMLIWWIMQLTCILTITCIRQWIKRYGTKHNIEKQPITKTWSFRLLYSVLLPIMGVGSVILAIYWAADVFNLSDLTWSIFSYKFINSPNFSLSILNITMVIILYFCFSYISQTVKELMHHYFLEHDPTTAESRMVMARNILQVVVWGTWLLIALAICHVSNTWLVVVSGGLSTGIGFAMKDIIENVYYGISLMAGRIKVGDWIICDGIRGRVSSISYTSTMFETVDGSTMAFQNSQLFTKNYKNMTRNHGYEMHTLDVGVAYGTDIEQTRKLLIEEIGKLDVINKRKGVKVVLREFGDSSVCLKVVVWVPVQTQYAADCEILECVYNTLNANDIQIPFPQRDLRIINTQM